jgi:mercuric ion transport protein
MQLDLLYFDGCPHVTAAKARLREALDSLGLTDSWREWDSTNAEMPDHLRGFPSPSILINGVDIEGGRPQEGATCAAGGAPTVEALRRALAAAASR